MRTNTSGVSPGQDGAVTPQRSLAVLENIEPDRSEARRLDAHADRDDVFVAP